MFFIILFFFLSILIASILQLFVFISSSSKDPGLSSIVRLINFRDEVYILILSLGRYHVPHLMEPIKIVC